MMLLPPSRISRRRWLEAGGLALLASFLAFASARAADRPITDDDLKHFLPRLRAEAAAAEKSRREVLTASAMIESVSAETEKLYNDFASGKTNVLAWIRAHTEYALVPAGAVYSAECSRTVSGEWTMATAIFTLGKESPHRGLLRRAAEGDSDALAEFNRLRGEEEAGERSAAVQAIYDLTLKTVSFYKDQGFVENEGLDRVVILTPLLSPDRSVFVNIWEVNPYSGVLPRNPLPPCATLPTGPMIEIEFVGGQIEEPSGAAAAEESSGGAAAEEPSDSEYERVKEALLLARLDEANPSALEVEIPNDAPPAVKAELAALQVEFAVRVANVAFYRKHEAALAPILEALLGTAGQ